MVDYTNDEIRQMDVKISTSVVLNKHFYIQNGRIYSGDNTCQDCGLYEVRLDGIYNIFVLTIACENCTSCERNYKYCKWCADELGCRSKYDCITGAGFCPGIFIYLI